VARRKDSSGQGVDGQARAFALLDAVWTCLEERRTRGRESRRGYEGAGRLLSRPTGANSRDRGRAMFLTDDDINTTGPLGAMVPGLVR
jgi:predicted outer membrane lipoprotein